jgi:hypothetical protein
VSLVAGALIDASRLGPDRSHGAPVGVSVLAVLGTVLALGVLSLVEPFQGLMGQVWTGRSLAAHSR